MNKITINDAAELSGIPARALNSWARDGTLAGAQQAKARGRWTLERGEFEAAIPALRERYEKYGHARLYGAVRDPIGLSIAGATLDDARKIGLSTESMNDLAGAARRTAAAVAQREVRAAMERVDLNRPETLRGLRCEMTDRTNVSAIPPRDRLYEEFALRVAIFAAGVLAALLAVYARR